MPRRSPLLRTLATLTGVVVCGLFAFASLFWIDDASREDATYSNMGEVWKVLTLTSQRGGGCPELPPSYLLNVDDGWGTKMQFDPAPRCEGYFITSSGADRIAKTCDDITDLWCCPVTRR